jgi:hypothetical protein
MTCRYHFEFVYVPTLKVTLVVVRLLYVLYNYVYVHIYLFLCFIGNLLYDRVERIYREITNSIQEGSLVITLSLQKIPMVVSRFTALTGLLVCVLLTTCII